MAEWSALLPVRVEEIGVRFYKDQTFNTTGMIG